MVKFNEETEEEILEIIKKYAYNNKQPLLLNYEFDGDEVVFNISINNVSELSVPDLLKIGEIIGGCFERFIVVNEQYRFFYTYSDKCVCDM